MPSAKYISTHVIAGLTRNLLHALEIAGQARNDITGEEISTAYKSSSYNRASV